MNQFANNSQLKQFVLSDNKDHLYLDNVRGNIRLDVLEIFNFLIFKKDIRGVKYSDVKIDDEIQNLIVKRSQWEIFFTIDTKPEYATLSCTIKSYSNVREVNLEELRFINEHKYLVKENELIAFSSESVAFSQLILEKINEDGTLPLLYSLELFSNRRTYKFIDFINHSIDISSILTSKQYSGKSSLFIKDLYDYQEDGLKWLQYCVLNKIGGIIGDDMGLGKTAQIISLVAWVIEREILSNILIVVPSTLIENWKREFTIFTPSIVPYIHHGPLRGGSIETLSHEKVIITSYSMIMNDLYLFNKVNWGVMIIDEASLIKNPSSERKISLSEINAEIKIAMTGTPVENSLIDLWSIVDFVFPGYLGTLDTFKSNYIKPSINQTIQESDLQSLKDDISFIMLRRKKENVLDSLPERIDIHQALQMRENEARIYDDERSRILSDINADSRSNVLTLIQNLRQYTTHPFMHSSELMQTADIYAFKRESAKFSRTIEILDEIKDCNEKVILFTEYISMIDAFLKLLSEYYKTEVYHIDGRVQVYERQQIIDRFSETNGFSIIVLNPKTAGMGLNITAANHVIHYTRQWNPALEEQASARSYRNKQQKNVNIYYLYYVNTIEEIIDDRLRAKTALSLETIAETEASIDELIKLLSQTPIK